MKSLFKNSIYNILYTALNVIFPLITSIIVSRILLADGIGKVSYVQTIATYFTSIATLGLPIYAVRILSQKITDSKTDFNKTYTELFIINLILNLIAIIVYFVLIFATPLFNTNKEIYIAFGIMVFFGTINVDWLYKGLEQYKFIALRNLVIKSLALLSVILFVKTKNDFLTYAYIVSCALSLNHLLNFAFSFKYCKFNFKEICLKQHFKPVLVISIASFLSLIYNKIDITMLGLMYSEDAVGLYYNAHQCINIILTCVTAVTAVFLPRLSSIIKEGKEDELQKVLKIGTNILIFLGLPACAGLIIVSPKLITLLFGESFSNAGTTLQILSALTIIVSIGDLLAYQLLIAKGYESKRILISFIGCIINIGLNALLIPRIAQNGAAIATIVSELFINTFLIIFICKKVSFKFDFNVIIKSLVATLIMSAIGVLTYIFIPNPIVACVVTILVGILVYLGSNILLKNPVLAIFKKETK